MTVPYLFELQLNVSVTQAGGTDLGTKRVPEFPN
jgi:hypothetical protein